MRASALPPRRFSLLDAMILVAATAVGAAFLRSYTKYGLPQWKALEGAAYRDLLCCQIADSALRFLEPWLLSWTIALLVIRLRQPRPELWKVARQPGMAACLGATVIVLLHAMLMAASHVLIGSYNWEQLYRNYFDVPFMAAGGSVGALWLLLGLARALRCERSWVDRLGRVLGVCWIIVCFVTALSGFIWDAGIDKHGYPPPTEEEMKILTRPG